MTLEEYKTLKKQSEYTVEHETKWSEDVVVVKDEVETTIKLGALEKFLQQGYSTKYADF
jgi:hypothetical protein